MIDKKKLAGIVLAGVLTVAGTTSAFAADTATDVKAPFQRQLFKIDKTEITAKIKSTIDSLVSSGTITQAQAEAVIKAYTPGERRGIVEEKLQLKRKSPMDALVTAGTITQAQADEIGKAIKTGMMEKKTIEEIFNELVKAGTITEAQKDAVQKAFPARPGKFIDKEHMNRDGINKGPFMKHGKSPLDELVSAGTITQAQADAINQAVKTSLKPSESNK